MPYRGSTEWNSEYAPADSSGLARTRAPLWPIGVREGVARVLTARGLDVPRSAFRHGRRLLGHDGGGLDLHEDGRIHEPADPHDRVRGTDVPEHLAVGPACLLPPGDVGHEHAG